MNWQLKILVSWPFTHVHWVFSVIRQKQILACNACWSVQTSVNDGKREIMWNISPCPIYIVSTEKYFQFISASFWIAVWNEASEGQVLLCPPPSAAAGSWDNILVPVYHKSVWTITQHGALLFPATFSKPAFHSFYPVTEDQLLNLGKCVKSTGSTSKLWPVPLRTA